MRIFAKAIVNYTDVNHFAYANQWIIRSGDQVTLYFQLVDLDQGSLRYMTGVGVSNQPVTVTVTFPSNAAALNTFNNDTNGGFVPFGSTLVFPVIDPAQVFVVTAALADPNDPSIWKIVLAPTQIPNSGNVQFSVIEGANPPKKFFVTNMIDVEPLDNGNC
jgi:hypothetical protein